MPPSAATDSALLTPRPALGAGQSSGDIAADASNAAGNQALQDARSQLAHAVGVLGYDRGLHDMLATARRELRVSVPLRRDSGEYEVLTGYRVQHNLARGPAKGGLR